MAVSAGKKKRSAGHQHAPGVPCPHDCLGGSWSELGHQVGELERLIENRPAVRRGQALFRPQTSFSSIYAVRRGFFKTTLLTESGHEQVTGFYMPGDVMGIEAISAGSHTTFATALRDSEVCEIPFSRLVELARQMPELQIHLYRMMSREIVRDHSMMVLLSNLRAEERLATFLLDLARRFQQLGLGSEGFHLPMTREEIGSFTGLTFETVSRTFSRLQDSGLISVERRLITIRDHSGLQAMASEFDLTHLR